MPYYEETNDIICTVFVGLPADEVTDKNIFVSQTLIKGFPTPMTLHVPCPEGTKKEGIMTGQLIDCGDPKTSSDPRVHELAEIFKRCTGQDARCVAWVEL